MVILLTQEDEGRGVDHGEPLGFKGSPPLPTDAAQTKTKFADDGATPRQLISEKDLWLSSRIVAPSLRRDTRNKAPVLTKRTGASFIQLPIISSGNSLRR